MLKQSLVKISILLTTLSMLTVSVGASATTSKLQSAGSLAFGPGNTLFVGDNKAGLVHAFELSSNQIDDQTKHVLGRAESFEGRTLVSNIDQAVADLLKSETGEILINDMVVHGPSSQIFLSVHNGRGPDAKAELLKVDMGELKRVDLNKVKHSSIAIGPVHTDEVFEFGQKLNALAITDIDYYKGELFVAGLSNDVFASKLRRIPYPFVGKVNTSSIEIWHAVHAQYETRSPIIAQKIVELDGEATLIAVYACTPIVRIPVKDLKDGVQIRGTMIGEMGFGNTPIDIVSFNNPMDKNDYVLVTNTNRSAAQIPLQAISSAEPMPSGKGVQPVFSVAGVAQYPMPLSGTLHLDTINKQWAVAIRRNPEEIGGIDLHTLPVPFFFDRADHIVEMNFADGPDPFGYKGLPPVEYK